MLFVAIAAKAQFQPKFGLQLTSGECYILNDEALIMPSMSTLLGLRYQWKGLRIDFDNQIWMDRSKDSFAEFTPKYGNFTFSAQYIIRKKWSIGVEHNCMHVIESVSDKSRDYFGGGKSAVFLKYGY